MAETPQIHGTLLARNTLLNLLGQVIPLLIGLATIPYIVRGLGTERFGVLAIAWVLRGYFSLLDLGLGQAASQEITVTECATRDAARRMQKEEGEHRLMLNVVAREVAGDATPRFLVGGR